MMDLHEESMLADLPNPFHPIADAIARPAKKSKSNITPHDEHCHQDWGYGLPAVDVSSDEDSLTDSLVDDLDPQLTLDDVEFTSTCPEPCPWPWDSTVLHSPNAPGPNPAPEGLTTVRRRSHENYTLLHDLARTGSSKEEVSESDA